MGTVRTIEWRLKASPEEAKAQILAALTQLAMKPSSADWTIKAKAPASLSKNRRGADLAIAIELLEGGAVATCRVDMRGDKHLSVIDEIAEVLGDDSFDREQPPLEVVPHVKGLPDVLATEWVRSEARSRVRELRGQIGAGELNELTPVDFEIAIARQLERLGYTQVAVVGGAGDLGADIKGFDPQGEPFIGQCKRYAADRTVSSGEMQLFVGMIVHHRATHGLYFTTGRFTAAARALADAHGIALYDRDRLSELIVDEDESPPRASLLAALVRDIIGEVRQKLVVGKVGAPHSPQIRTVLLQDGRTGVLAASMLERPLFRGTSDPRNLGLLAQHAGRTERFAIVGDADDGTPILSRREAVEFEHRDARHRLLAGLRGQTEISVTIEEVRDTSASGSVVIGPHYFRVLFSKDWLGVKDFYKMSEFLEPGMSTAAFVVGVDLSTQMVAASLEIEGEPMMASP